MPFTTLLIDLDDTVYPADSGMWDAIAARIDRYMHERLGIPAASIPALRHELHARYGTTLRGLAATRAMDELDYLAFVHDVPVARYLRPDPAVRAALSAIPLPLWIFTNADRAHAGRVLAALELQDLFTGIIDIQDVHPYCKPMPLAFERALERAAAAPADCIFVDDSAVNLAAAARAGLRGIRVGSPQPAPSGEAVSGPICIPSLAELPRAMRCLEDPVHTDLINPC